MNDGPLKQVEKRKLDDLDHLTPPSSIKGCPLMGDEKSGQSTKPLKAITISLDLIEFRNSNVTTHMKRYNIINID